MPKSKTDIDRAYQRGAGYAALREKNWRKQGIRFHGRPLRWEVFAALLDFQRHRCAISGGDEMWSRLGADHDHRTGELRGAIDGRINHHALGTYERTGHYRDAAHERLLREYLADPPAQSERFERFLTARGIEK